MLTAVPPPIFDNTRKKRYLLEGRYNGTYVVWFMLYTEDLSVF